MLLHYFNNNHRDSITLSFFGQQFGKIQSYIVPNKHIMKIKEKINTGKKNRKITINLKMKSNKDTK